MGLKCVGGAYAGAKRDGSLPATHFDVLRVIVDVLVTRAV